MFTIVFFNKKKKMVAKENVMIACFLHLHLI